MASDIAKPQKSEYHRFLDLHSPVRPRQAKPKSAKGCTPQRNKQKAKESQAKPPKAGCNATTTTHNAQRKSDSRFSRRFRSENQKEFNSFSDIPPCALPLRINGRSRGVSKRYIFQMKREFVCDVFVATVSK